MALVTVALTAICLPMAATASTASAPLAGRWLFENGYRTENEAALDFSTLSDGSVTGWVEPAAGSAQCLADNGGPGNFYRATGSGDRYTGTARWFFTSTCGLDGIGPALFVVDTSVVPNTLSVCTNQPGSVAPTGVSDCDSLAVLTRGTDPFAGRTGLTISSGVGYSGGDLSLTAQCGSSYYQGTSPCDATYYVWHCGSSYSQGFTTCPPGTPGALPPLARRRGAVAVKVAGGQTTIAPHRRVTLRLPLTRAARRALRSPHRAVTFFVRVTNTENDAAQTIRLTLPRRR